MKILKFLWEILKCCGRWWNTNATKRWVLALDRLTIFLLIPAMYNSVAKVIYDRFDHFEGFVFFVGVALVFILLYTPGYMFPSSDQPVSPSADPSDVKKEP